MVGRIIRPHGLRGELSVEVRTDDPGRRYANGSVLGTEPPQAGPLTVTASRWHSGRLLVSFAEVVDRADAELLRGVLLTVDAAQVPLPQDPDEFHDHQLTGLTVVTVSGELVGTVSDVLHYGQDLLSVTPPAGTSRQEEVLVPFVAAIAVEVDLVAGKVVIDPPPGLLDLATAGARSDGGADPDGSDADRGISDATSNGAKADAAEATAAEAAGAKAASDGAASGDSGSSASGPDPGGHGED